MRNLFGSRCEMKWFWLSNTETSTLTVVAFARKVGVSAGTSFGFLYSEGIGASAGAGAASAGFLGFATESLLCDCGASWALRGREATGVSAKLAKAASSTEYFMTYHLCWPAPRRVQCTQRSRFESFL